MTQDINIEDKSRPYVAFRIMESMIEKEIVSPESKDQYLDLYEECLETTYRSVHRCR